MFSYKQRYKPRTNREYTKSDLTVYDSAGNTALNALTIYGKSEIVDGAIKSAGEGYAVVDLGTLAWSYNAEYRRFISNDIKQQVKIPNSNDVPNFLCPNYAVTSINYFINSDENNIIACGSGGIISIRNTTYTDPTAFKNSLNGVLLCYLLADPTQGNAIAIKTDNGYGIDGRMAVFKTGTPLYGISDTVRDIMTWDGTSGEVTNNYGEVDLGTLNWTLRTSSTNPIFYTYVPIAKINSNGIISATAYTKYPNTYASNFGDNYPDKSWCMSSANNQIYFRDDSILTEADFTTAMSGVKLVYELATPTTTPLTQAENESVASLRTFDGTTHFTNSTTTDMTVNYTIKVPTIS